MVIGGTDYCVFCQRHTGESVDENGVCKACRRARNTVTYVMLTGTRAVNVSAIVTVIHPKGEDLKKILKAAKEIADEAKWTDDDTGHSVEWEDVSEMDGAEEVSAEYAPLDGDECVVDISRDSEERTVQVGLPLSPSDASS